MTNIQRNGGLALIAAAAISLAGCAAVAVEASDTTLSSDLVGYPWSGTALVVFSAGLLALVVIGLQATPLLWLGVAFYALGFAVLGVAMATGPVARLQTA